MWRERKRRIKKGRKEWRVKIRYDKVEKRVKSRNKRTKCNKSEERKDRLNKGGN